MKKQYNIFVDIDGVLADFWKKVGDLIGEPYDHGLYQTDREYKKRCWKAVSTHQQNGGQFWYELELMSDAAQLWRHLKKYNPVILTATGREARKTHHVALQKRGWINKQFGRGVGVIAVRDGADKAKYADSDSILIDDRQSVIDTWVKAGGIGILHTSAQITIQKLKELGI